MYSYRSEYYLMNVCVCVCMFRNQRIALSVVPLELSTLLSETRSFTVA